MAASQFGPTTQVNHTAPSQAVQPGFLDSTGKLQPGQIDDSGNIKTTGGGGGGGGAVTIADGADVTEGAIADVAVTGDNSGTESAKLRGLNKIWADVWDSVNHWLKVSIQNTTLAVTQSGAWTVAGDVASGSADSGNPVKIGGKAGTALPTVVTTGQRVNGLFDVYGRLFGRHGAQGPSGSYWATNHAPAANTKATISKASAGSGVRNVCTSITVVLAAGATAPTAIQVSVALIDGASGGSTYLWGPNVISLPAVAGATSAFVLSQCWKPGSAATAMTLEFSAAGGANTIESVSMDGTVVAE